MLILGIESSCDDTAAAVLKGESVLASILSSQDAIHSQFGGVVPELASRKHLQSIHPVVMSALTKAGVQLSDIDLIAATQGPGLIGSLLVGFSYAKALSHVKKIPFVGVDHMAGHILSVFLGAEKPAFPYIALIASGGTSSIFLAENSHTFHHLGRTRDDAAGEAFDKVAKLLELGYPGGPVISRTAVDGNPQYVQFPRAWLDENSLDFSFSGLKTAVLNHVNQQKQQNKALWFPDICASFQEAVVDVLVAKTILAARRHQIGTIVIGGGVSANPRLRELFAECCNKEGVAFYAPERDYCTDNAAMIALAGSHKYAVCGASTLDEDVYSRSPLG
ncbi:MAG TPA: tRNA (adenosine(37)-N6)-threonylcarbamoyltransferase complex transferase subunit TsaD [Desulfobulbaceae bacterium]|nr:tRNA (adenosine(37)-N6)-threonylcarbamoyltransferase complex transferase subunit TsaD [Desulfobulbaceae bacterium]